MTEDRGVIGKKGEAALARFLQTHGAHQEAPRLATPRALGRIWTLRCVPCGDYWVSGEEPTLPAEWTGEVFGRVS